MSGKRWHANALGGGIYRDELAPLHTMRDAVEKKPSCSSESSKRPESKKPQQLLSMLVREELYFANAYQRP